MNPAPELPRDDLKDLLRMMAQNPPKVRSTDEPPHDLSFLSYQDYLRSGHWMEISAREKKTANYQCELCGNGRSTLNVHHLYNLSECMGREEPRDLMVLCQGCHEEVHGKDLGSFF
jgi:5-methylcytosine-specific restriction endonuclease McrA